MRALRGPFSSTGRLPRALFGASALVALAAFALPASWSAPDEPAPVPTPILAASPAGEAPLLRPLFDPGRRPWTARGSREAVLAPDPPRPVLTLRGILFDGGAPRALIDDGSGDLGWLARGQGRGDWRITAIEPGGVTLTQRGQSYTTAFMGQPAILRPVPVRIEAGVPALRP
ncbi:hypothetical protein [Methylobacterium gregans]|uniref:General secretion pathway protein GspN n=1 Tax=Methylobacterium gregans TaxID=374424 RepID=A0AA37MFR5_9HYPH|nr:hypothetical protein [Methylobacterium gregans]MDQ0523739.1 hypothetical protein [Methylobacterium gregans]GJD81196.1 hypothetical protein NBEOAGPD_4441 [Methylobacterium gregans]GLS54816.1 hypothetical protein GCM10007886_30000 [Methylobacterium gregans]